MHDGDQSCKSEVEDKREKRLSEQTAARSHQMHSLQLKGLIPPEPPLSREILGTQLTGNSSRYLKKLLVGPVVRICRSHRQGPGSIPGLGTHLLPRLLIDIVESWDSFCLADHGDTE